MSASSSPVLSKLFQVGTINTIIGGARGGAGGKRAGYVAEKCAACNHAWPATAAGHTLSLNRATLACLGTRGSSRT